MALNNMNTDKSNMRGVIIDSSSQLRKGLELAENVKIQGKFENVIICGIGGSALPVNVLNSAFNSSVPVLAHRDYSLPKEANKNSLIICVSYSGNTEETVSALEEALQKNLKVIGIATGGKIEKICQENNVQLVKIPSGIQPRSATGYLFSALAKILAVAGVIEDASKEIIKTSDELEKITQDLEKQAKNLAKKLAGKTPVIYSSDKFKALARIWKIKFNENSKIPAFWNYFPELNHNEMVGFSEKNGNCNFHFIIIKDKDEHARNLKRMELFSKLMIERGLEVDFVELPEGSNLFKIFSNLMLGDWASYYLALENKTDPTPVKIVEDFKKMLAE